MNRLEEYINGNIKAFDEVEVPSGRKEAFMRRIQAQRQKTFRRRSIVVTLGLIAASAAILLLLLPRGLTFEIHSHHRRLGMKEAEILSVISTAAPDMLDEVSNTIRGITYEAIPLEEQLPEELDDKAKKEILKEYYTRKYLALERILNQYTQIN